MPEVGSKQNFNILFIVFPGKGSYNGIEINHPRKEFFVPMKKLLFIYNCHAGRKQARNGLADMIDAFAREGYEITAHPTRFKGDAAATAAACEGYDRVVCCGGDGTLNETVTGLMRLPPEKRPVLGYIPTGSANDFSRNISLPKGLSNMAEVACGGVPRVCDLGLSEGGYFTYVAAFGLFTEVSYATPQANKNLLGHFAYVLEGAGKLTSIPTYTVRVESEDGRVEEGQFIYGMVSNTVSVGGLMKLPRDRVQLDDGLFEVLLVRAPKTPKDLQEILLGLSTQKMPDGGALVCFPTRKITFTSQTPLKWTLDGEFGGERTVTTIENLPKAYTLACGE